MRTAIITLAVLVVASNLCGADLQGISYIGVRLGVGHTNQDTPDVVYDGNYTVNTDQNGFYTEIFYNWHFLDQLALEVGLAALNRGEYRLIFSDYNYFGGINLYPIMVGLKVKPLASMLPQAYQPWFSGGGSIVVGRAPIEGGTYYYDYFYTAESGTTFGWWLGGGFDSFISTNICLSSSFKYLNMKFDEVIGGYKDHSGYQISFGIAYIFRKNR